MRLILQEVLNQDVQEPPDNDQLRALARRQAHQVQLLCGYYVVMLATLIFALVTLHGQLALIGLLGAYLGVLLNPGRNAQHYDPIPGSACQAALDCFSLSPEGKRYLGKLREMGRPVTGFDVEAVTAWNDTVARIAQLKQIRAQEQIDEFDRRKLYAREA